MEPEGATQEAHRRLWKVRLFPAVAVWLRGSPKGTPHVLACRPGEGALNRKRSLPMG